MNASQNVFKYSYVDHSYVVAHIQHFSAVVTVAIIIMKLGPSRATLSGSLHKVIIHYSIMTLISVLMDLIQFRVNAGPQLTNYLLSMKKLFNVYIIIYDN